MSWKNAIKKAPRLSRTTDLFGGGPDIVSDVDSTVTQFMQSFGMNRNSAYKKYNLTDEEIKAVEKAYEKVLQAREDFREFLKAMDWYDNIDIKKEEQIDIKDYTEMLDKLRQLAQKHNPNAMAHVDKLEEELLHLNTERAYGKR